MNRTNQVAIITGGGGYIGGAIARLFAEEGATVVLCDIQQGPMDEVVADITQKGGKAWTFKTDIRDKASIADAVRTTLERHGRIDILANVAGGSAREEIARIHLEKEEVIDQILGVNFYGAFYFCRAVAPVMIGQKSGKIINIGSAVGIKGQAGLCDYSAAKGAVITLTKSLAMELGPHNINVNCVSPGLVPRPGTNKDYVPATNYLQKCCTAEDVAHLVDFLASDKAGFILGENVVIDGGWSLGLKGDSSRQLR
ncbi:MAG: SDR family oxidoreductase [Opitutaceae bacterium]|jgi:NAD(P)-dependent dehydrogenase (short-subunit alcohol dehydrogenase family)